jgi:hypothetical protein
MLSPTRTQQPALLYLLTIAVIVSACGQAEAVSPAAASIEEPPVEALTWRGEIAVCVGATDDVPGCQWLAGILIHRGCDLESYQTFAAALSVGGAFEPLYQNAVAGGGCEPLLSGDLDI